MNNSGPLLPSSGLTLPTFDSFRSTRQQTAPLLEHASSMSGDEGERSSTQEVDLAELLQMQTQFSELLEKVSLLDAKLTESEREKSELVLSVDEIPLLLAQISDLRNNLQEAEERAQKAENECLRLRGAQAELLRDSEESEGFGKEEKERLEEQLRRSQRELHLFKLSHGSDEVVASERDLENAPPEKLRLVISTLRQEKRLLELTLAQQLSDEKNNLLFSPQKGGMRANNNWSARVSSFPSVNQVLEENKQNLLENELLRDRVAVLEDEKRRNDSEKKRMRLSFQLQRDKYRQKVENLSEEIKALKGLRFSYIGEDLRERERELLRRKKEEDEEDDDEGDDLVVEDEYRRLEDDNELLRHNVKELRESLAEVTAEKKALEAQMQSTASLRIELEVARKETQKANEIIEKLLEENSSLINAQSFSHRRDAVSKQSQAVETLMREKEVIAAQLHAQHDKLRQVSFEKAQLEDTLKMRTRAYEEAQSMILQLKELIGVEAKSKVFASPNIHAKTTLTSTGAYEDDGGDGARSRTNSVGAFKSSQAEGAPLSYLAEVAPRPPEAVDVEAENEVSEGRRKEESKGDQESRGWVASFWGVVTGSD